MPGREATRIANKKFDRSLLPAAPDLCFEMALWKNDTRLVAGIDEAGRGALAGPVAAAVLVLPVDPGLCQTLNGVRDSKEMSPAARQVWAERLRRQAVVFEVGFASHQEIDDLGIVPATRLAVYRALAALAVQPQHLLVDYLDLTAVSIPQTSLVKGDARSLSIAGASILAKTARDAWMCSLDGEYPGYGFAQHKGYGTAAHRRALAEFGPCPIHRRSFSFRRNSGG
jgi:ribonuclease HII